jgi:hypothetical protein
VRGRTEEAEVGIGGDRRGEVPLGDAAVAVLVRPYAHADHPRAPHPKVGGVPGLDVVAEGEVELGVQQTLVHHREEELLVAHHLGGGGNYVSA